MRDNVEVLLLAIWVTMFVLISPATGRSEDKIVIAYSGVSGFQGPLWAYKEMNLFQKYGLSPEIVLIGGGTQSMQTLLSGANRAIDATFLSPPSTTEARKMGLTSLAHMGAMQAFFPMTVVAVTRDFLEEKRAVVKQFVKGYSEAIYRLMQSKDAMIGVYRKYLKQQDNKILEETYDDIAGKFSFPPRVNSRGHAQHVATGQSEGRRKTERTD